MYVRYRHNPAECGGSSPSLLQKLHIWESADRLRQLYNKVAITMRFLTTVLEGFQYDRVCILLENWGFRKVIGTVAPSCEPLNSS